MVTSTNACVAFRDEKIMLTEAYGPITVQLAVKLNFDHVQLHQRLCDRGRRLRTPDRLLELLGVQILERLPHERAQPKGDHPWQ